MEKYVEKQDLRHIEITRRQRLSDKYLNWRFAAKVLSTIALYVLAIGIAFVIIYPLFRRVCNAFKSAEDFRDSSVVYFPKRPTMQTIKLTSDGMQWGTAGLRSLLLALGVGILQTVVATLASYGFARFQFRGSKLLFGLVLLVLVVPPQAIVIPLYLRFRWLDVFGLFQTILGKPLNLHESIWPQMLMAATGVGWKNGLYIFMMRQYFRGIPRVLEEAAYIDGAKTFRAFFSVMLPSATPMMMTVFLFSFCWQWTDVFYTNMFMDKTRLLTTNISKYIRHADPIVSLNMQQTAILMLTLPLILLFIVTQRYFVEGIERSGIVG